MNIFRPFLILGLMVALAGSTGTAEGAKKKTAKKKGGEKTHHGVVEKVHLDKDKDHGSLTLKEHHHKKGAAKGKSASKSLASKEQGAKHEHFVLTKHTKVERHGKPAHLKSLKPGEHVVVISKGHVAEKIEILKEKAKGKKKLHKKQQKKAA